MDLDWLVKILYRVVLSKIQLDIKTSFKLVPSIRGLESFKFIFFCSEGWMARFFES